VCDVEARIATDELVAILNERCVSVRPGTKVPATTLQSLNQSSWNVRTAVVALSTKNMKSLMTALFYLLVGLVTIKIILIVSFLKNND